MAKKKAKKDDKKSKSKDALSNLERVKYLLIVEELEHKIKSRQHFIDLHADSKAKHEEAYEKQKEDTAEAVAVLEQAIRDHQQTTEAYQRVIDESGMRLRTMQEENALLLAAKLKKVEASTVEERKVLEKLQEELEDSENYDASRRLEEEFELARELNRKVPRGELQKMSEQARRRGWAFAKVAWDFVDKEMERHFAELDASIPKEEKRLKEENELLKEKIAYLNHFVNHNEAIRSKDLVATRELEKSLESKRDAYQKAFEDFRTNETVLYEIAGKRRGMSQRRPVRIEGDETSTVEKAKVDSAYLAFKKEGDLVVRSLQQVKEMEEKVRRMEEVLLKEEAFGEDLRSFAERAMEIVREEAKTPLIVTTYNGPLPRLKTIEGLQKVLDEATKFIYERGTRTMV